MRARPEGRRPDGELQSKRTRPEAELCPEHASQRAAGPMASVKASKRGQRAKGPMPSVKTSERGQRPSFAHVSARSLHEPEGRRPEWRAHAHILQCPPSPPFRSHLQIQPLTSPPIAVLPPLQPFRHLPHDLHNDFDNKAKARRVPRGPRAPRTTQKTSYQYKSTIIYVVKYSIHLLRYRTQT